MQRLKAVVTGHSRGLGAALAHELINRKFQVLGISRKSNPAFLNTPGGYGQEVLCDLSQPDAVDDWLQSAALAQFLIGADALLLINNAGTIVPTGLLGTLDTSEVVKAVSLNVTTPIVLANAMLARRPANLAIKILHISSGAGRRAYPGWSVYGATKAALDQHARSVQAEKQAFVKIVSLAPGVIDTEMQAAIRSIEPALFPERERFIALHQQQQLTSSQEAANRILDFMMSPSFGEVPVVDLRDLGSSEI